MFKAGDCVYGSAITSFGAHAEYKCLPEMGALAPIPTHLTYGEAVAICDGGLTVLTFLRDIARIRSGQKVLINGASGAVGIYAVQIAKHYGADVTAVCGGANAPLVLSHGADRAIDYANEDFTRLGEAFDVVFDAVGKSSFSKCKSILKAGGAYLGTVPTPAILFQTMWTKKFGDKRAIFSATGLKQNKENLLFLNELAVAGRIRPVIDRHYPLERIAEAHAYVEQGHKRGNVVIDIR